MTANRIVVVLVATGNCWAGEDLNDSIDTLGPPEVGIVDSNTSQRVVSELREAQLELIEGRRRADPESTGDYIEKLRSLGASVRVQEFGFENAASGDTKKLLPRGIMLPISAGDDVEGSFARDLVICFNDFATGEISRNEFETQRNLVLERQPTVMKESPSVSRGNVDPAVSSAVAQLDLSDHDGTLEGMTQLYLEVGRALSSLSRDARTGIIMDGDGSLIRLLGEISVALDSLSEIGELENSSNK